MMMRVRVMRDTEAALVSVLSATGLCRHLMMVNVHHAVAAAADSLDNGPSIFCVHVRVYICFRST